MHVLAVAALFLHGVVTMGPTQPVCQVGVPCSKPAANLELVFRPTTGPKLVTRTDGQGRYSLHLQRGSYTVDVVPPRRIGSGLSPRRITVRRSPQRIDFALDTGIR